MSGLKTLKDIEYYNAPIREKSRIIDRWEVQQLAIQWAKEQSVFCSCGRKCIPHYEGEAICPEYERLLYGNGDMPSDEEWTRLREEHQSECYSSDQIAVFDWIVEFFNLDEEECK